MAIYLNYDVPEPPPLNEKLLDCVLKHIEEHPENYNQNVWIDLGTGQTTEEVECGTAACVAGWACLLSLSPEVSYIDFCKETGTGCNNPYSPNHTSTKARVLLGLTPEEASALFKSATGTKADILREVKERVRQIKFRRGLK